MQAFLKPPFYFFLLFSAAIIIEKYINIDISIVYYIIISFLLLVGIIVFRKIRFDILRNVFLWLFIFSFFLFYCHIYNEIYGYTSLTKDNQKKIEKSNRYLGFIGEIISNPIIKLSKSENQNLVFNLKLSYAYLFSDEKSNINKDLKSHYQIIDIKAKLIVYIPYKELKNSKIILYKGDSVYIDGTLRFTESYLNLKHSHLSNFGNYLYNNNISGFLYVNKKDIKNIYKIIESQNTINNYFHDFKLDIENHFDNMFDSKKKSILKGILWGDTGLIPSDIKKDFANTGTAHVLAVSGLHIGFIVIIFIAIFWFIPIPKKWIYVIIIIPLIAYWIFVGMKISITRAIIMYICLFVVNRFLNKSSDSLNNLFIAGIIIYFIEPSSLFQISFQMSFAAVAGIIIFYPIIYKLIINKISKTKFIIFLNNHNFLSKIFKAITGMLIVSIASDIVLTPIIIYHFKQIPLAGIITNPVIINIVFILVILSFVFIIMCNIFKLLIEYFTYIIDNILDLLIFYIREINDLGLIIYINDDIKFIVLSIYIPCIFALIYLLNKIKIHQK